ncbi:MAG: signal peptidase I [Candidatus Saccharibacteria bacterium]
MDPNTNTPTPPQEPQQPTTVTPPTNDNISQILGTPQTIIPDTREPEASTLQKTANAFTGLFAAIFSWVVFPILIVIVLHNFVFQAYHVVGTSMASTLQPSDYLIISKVSYTKALIARSFKKDVKYIPARGQIIVFHYPRDPTEVFVKRVVGLPGDRVVIKEGKVTVYTKDKPNGFNPDTKYEKTDTQTLIDTDETVATGSIFVMGDNRTPGGSYDSREWGELESSYIIGNAVLRLLPLDQAKVL